MDYRQDSYRYISFKWIGNIIADNFMGDPADPKSSKQVNVPFYRRFGFEVIEKTQPPKGCPPLWAMWREGRRG